MGYTQCAAATDEEAAAAYCQFIKQLKFYLEGLEHMATNDMGWLREEPAGEFHKAVESLDNLKRKLQQDAMWPHEPDEPIYF